MLTKHIPYSLLLTKRSTVPSFGKTLSKNILADFASYLEFGFGAFSRHLPYLYAGKLTDGEFIF